jgi:hypothetical protein
MAGTVTAAGAAPATAAARTVAGGYVPHRCYVSNLAARFHGAQAGLGNRGFLLTLTNVSGASCRIDGYPGLGLRGRGGPGAAHQGAAGADLLKPGSGAAADRAVARGDRERGRLVRGGGAADELGARDLPGGLAARRPSWHRPADPGRATLVYRARMDVTALARHTRYFP